MPGDVGVPALEAVGVLGAELAPGPGGHPDHDRHVELAARHVEQGRRVVHDLVEGKQAEVHRHDLDDGSHPAEGGADAGTDEAGLRQGRVPDALGPELLEQAQAHCVAAAVAPDVLTHEEDAFVALEGLRQRPAQRLAVGDGAHGARFREGALGDHEPLQVLDGLEGAGVGEGDGVVDLGVDVGLDAFEVTVARARSRP